MRHPPLLTLANRLRTPTRLPRAWLLTDPRAGDPFALLARLPRSIGLIVRHYEAADREDLAGRLVKLAGRQRRCVLVAGDDRLALRLGANGVHWPEALVRQRRRPRHGWIVTAAAHGRTGLVRAARSGADLALLSPVFATRSHAGSRPLGPARSGLLLTGRRPPVAALGGLDLRTAKSAITRRFSALAAIDGWQQMPS